MTTHYVDIRAKASGLAGQWESLTRTPIPHKDALALQRQIGESWDSRVRPVLMDDGVVTTKTILERIALLGDDPRVPVLRQDGVDPTDAELVTVVRAGLFGVLERYRMSDVFHRFRADGHKLVHDKKCKRGRARAEVGPLTVPGYRFALMTELEQRVRHLNEMTIPALGILATASAQQPRIHTLTCNQCDATSEAVSVAVSITWRTHTMTREYLLP